MAQRQTDLHLDLDKRRRVLEAWVEKKRQIAVLECEAMEVMVEQIGFHEADVAGNGFHRDAIYRSMVAEFSAAARIPTGSVEFAFTDALVVSTSLPEVRAAFAAGRVCAGHVREIVRESAIVAEAIRNKRVDADVMGLYEAAVLVFAERETAARTKAHAAQVAAALVGETVTDRHQRAASERCVKVRSVGDGLALLTAVLPEWVAVAIADRLRQMTRQVIRNRAHARDADSGSGSGPACDSGSVIFSDDTFATDPDTDTDTDTDADTGADAEDVAADTRTWDQVQADLLADLLLTADPSAIHGDGLDNIQGRIQVTIAGTTLAGEDERPADLDGHGPLHPDIARDLAGRNTGWSRLFLDPDGMVRETDTYTPTEGMRRFLRARDQHCRFPGCRMPVHRCDIDHTHDHARGGKTRLDNLAHLCRAHHTLKHPDVSDAHRWTARQERDGTITWHSPLGRTYTDRPTHRVMFT
ncbi:HNH endonuclease signature motif containing protein [Microbacterium sp. LWH11-1.2]|uniref:HNH endonuclease signature motif containing protein n=1 Tax=Microbacterium sp. LWH11-1.2 TaxID=3135258 RepID=UPI003138F035